MRPQASRCSDHRRWGAPLMVLREAAEGLTWGSQAPGQAGTAPSEAGSCQQPVADFAPWSHLKELGKQMKPPSLTGGRRPRSSGSQGREPPEPLQVGCSWYICRLPGSWPPQEAAHRVPLWTGLRGHDQGAGRRPGWSCIAGRYIQGTCCAVPTKDRPDLGSTRPPPFFSPHPVVPTRRLPKICHQGLDSVGI